ncbi:hypothetical protein K488DRAFT_46388 [Vararia minispora EC-137]|uniref:Uncharacterized protein n=1 Tax=Vararia minispora EC-137 TaxID=1314806 RepID=A0ACB8QQB1_9AGAM|nr:hypothetical protein K488DRAFT_46388 [Vararia minispora EC-137]
MASGSQSQQFPASTSATNGKTAVVAQGDWTKNLVQLAKNAELKKHALTLQLHTAHILSAHASLDQKEREIQDVKEQKNKLDSERLRLLKCLAEVNVDRDKMDLKEVQINSECEELRTRIQRITDGEYALAKREVDKLRGELGYSPMQSLQSLIEEKAQLYLQERLQESAKKRGAEDATLASGSAAPAKRPRGRPKGSKNKKGADASPTA